MLGLASPPSSNFCLQGQPAHGGPAPPPCVSWKPPPMSPRLEEAGDPFTAPQNVAASLPRSRPL